MKVPIGVSNRHIHLNESDYKSLFGETEMKVERYLEQPGEYASNLFVTIKTEKSSIDKVRVLGPFRDYTQVEISKTDSYKLGLNPPIRDSGDLIGSSPITVVGLTGELNLKEGCIIPNRHIHISPDKIKEFGLEGLTSVKVLLTSSKGGILHNVMLKVSENFVLALHLDTDDGNGNLVSTGDEAEIIK